MVKKARGQHPIHHHVSLGIAAAITGVALGFMLVNFNIGVNPESLVAASAPTLAQRCQTNARAGQINAPIVTDQSCLVQCQGGPSGKGPKGRQNPACLCGKELGKADAGVTNCYNPGDCTPPSGLAACGSVEKPKLPGEEQGKGGEEKMPELPKMPSGGGGGGGGEPPPTTPTEEECKKEPKPEGCAAGVSNGLLDSFKDIFSTDSTAKEGEQKSVTTKLMEFLTGDSSAPAATSPASAINNPTEAKVTPVVSGANAVQISGSQGGTTQSGSSGTGVSDAPNSTVTGFGSGAQADVQTSTGPIVTAMNNVLSKISNLLSSWF